VIVMDQNQLNQVRLRLTSTKNPIVIDTETNKDWIVREDRYCMGFSLCIDRETFYIPVEHYEWGAEEPTGVDITGFFDVLPNVPLVFHNAKWDVDVLEQMKIVLPVEQVFCTLVMAHLIDENEFNYSLDYLVSKYLGIHKDTKLAKAMDAYKWEHVPVKIMGKYSEQDAIVTWNLFYYLLNKFDLYQGLWEATDRDFMYLLKEMEVKGIRVNKERVQVSLKETEKWCDGYVKQLGFDPGKKSLLEEYVFGVLGLEPLSYTPKTHKPQINTKFLERTDHAWCKGFREFKQQQKRLTSYYRPYLRLAPHGRFHPEFKQHGTVTGRLSCADPNMQQIPRDSDIKGFFMPEEGCELWELDYRTLEFRLGAVYGKQQNALEIFHAEGDIHQLTASSLGVPRQEGKTINFALAYGAGAGQLADTMGIPEDQAQSIVTDFRKTYSDMYRKSKEAAVICQAQGGKVKMWHGRYRHFIHSNQYHNAWSACIQGGSFQIVKVGMLKLREKGFDMRNQVHDAVWLNLDPSKRSIESQLEEASALLSDWTVEMFGLRFSTEAKRLS
jgi:DNA polymerase I